ncbi:hypothetical protein F2P81_008975 [Scophthalmus maximus]|uniref:Uridylate-specific endoribonuclease n=1 Tax=Scophthalmus maximus TaxID=52904 RepID=A0A6A4T5V5_SCOMX|nr:hypothetical protein F2P81_008975 [Scophthalmus maximus]
MIESDRELSAMVQELWDNDVNRLKPGKDYRISLQGKAGDSMALNDNNDGAGYPLFTFVDENIFKKETFLAFISLLDNYESDTGEPEIVTPEEVAENHKFLDSIIQTPTMKIAHKYLVEKHLSPEDPTKFKEQLYTIWFELYARRGSSRPDSSGFEHVFVGETRGGRTVIGFHNWIQLYLQEKLGHIDYKGYSVNAHSPQPDENKHILALQFSWKNGIKPKGSIFIGVSPEFEFALYTLCFLTSPNERVKVQFSFYDVEIVCHHYNQKHIGTTYPVLLSQFQFRLVVLCANNEKKKSNPQVCAIMSLPCLYTDGYNTHILHVPHRKGGGGGFVVAIDVNDLGEQELHQVDESAEETAPLDSGVSSRGRGSCSLCRRLSLQFVLLHNLSFFLFLLSPDVLAASLLAPLSPTPSRSPRNGRTERQISAAGEKKKKLHRRVGSSSSSSSPPPPVDRRRFLWTPSVCLTVNELPDEDDPEESPQVAAEAPPPYSSIAADNAAYFDYKEDGAFPKPPSYNVATTLPSYDEAERTKAETTVPLFSTYFPGYFDGQYWLWWVFLVLGFLLFLRGFINYARIRKMADTFSTLPHTRVLFIY